MCRRDIFDKTFCFQQDGTPIFQNRSTEIYSSIWHGDGLLSDESGINRILGLVITLVVFEQPDDNKIHNRVCEAYQTVALNKWGGSWTSLNDDRDKPLLLLPTKLEPGLYYKLPAK